MFKSVPTGSVFEPAPASMIPGNGILCTKTGTLGTDISGIVKLASNAVAAEATRASESTANETLEAQRISMGLLS